MELALARDGTVPCNMNTRRLYLIALMFRVTRAVFFFTRDVDHFVTSMHAGTLSSRGQLRVRVITAQ